MGRTRKLLPAKAGKRLRSLEYEYEIEVFIKIGLRTASAAAASRHRARPDLQRFRVSHSGSAVPPIGRAYRSLLSTASVHRGGVPSRWEGPVSSYLPKQVRDCGAWNMNMKSRSLLKSGSGVAPPRPARSAALPGPSFGLCTASVVNIGLGSPFTTFRAYRSLFSTASAMEDHPSAHHLISAAFGSLRKTSSLHAYLFEFIL